MLVIDTLPRYHEIWASDGAMLGQRRRRHQNNTEFIMTSNIKKNHISRPISNSGHVFCRVRNSTKYVSICILFLMIFLSYKKIAHLVKFLNLDMCFESGIQRDMCQFLFYF